MRNLSFFQVRFFRNPLLQLLVLLLALLGAMSLATGFFPIRFGQGNFWDKHGLFFLIFITFFPRLTLLFSSVPFGGLFWWLGFFFMPRLLVAILATVNYLQQNPLLVLIAWLVALGGEGTEKAWVTRPMRRGRFQNRPTGNEAAKPREGRSKPRDISVDYRVED